MVVNEFSFIGLLVESLLINNIKTFFGHRRLSCTTEGSDHESTLR